MAQATSIEQNQEIVVRVINELKKRKFEMPTLPDLVAKIKRAIDDPSMTTKKLANLLGTEQVISARVIQIANSSMFVGMPKVASLHSAINRLGLHCVRTVAVSINARQLFKIQKSIRLQRKMREVWEHSTLVAATSEVLARDFTKLSPYEALLAGILHNIGVIPVLNKCADNPALLDNPQLIDHIMDAVVCELGGWILEQWDMPASIVDVARYHRDLARQHEGRADFVDVVMVANLHGYLGKKHPLSSVPWVKVPAFNKLNLTPEDSIHALMEARKEIQAIRRSLS